MNLKAHLLVPTPQNEDKGLWFIFHHEPDGLLAVDLTREHPDLPYRHFEPLAGHDPSEKIILLGGPEQSDTAMLVLHNDRNALPDAHVINDHFSFFSRKFLLVSGQPPLFTNADEEPSKITLAPTADFIITMGFRVWNMDTLEEDLKNWQWHFLPATPEIVFNTNREDRLQKALLSIN